MRRLFSLLLVLALGAPAGAARLHVPAVQAARAPSVSAVAALKLPDPGTTLSAFTLATHHLEPRGVDALAVLRGEHVLDVGAGRDAAMARHLVGELGFDPDKVHALDPRLDPGALAPLPAGNARRARAEELPSDWAGKFDTAFSFFVFNPEIVRGDTPGMGDGIDVEAAAEAVHAALKPGGRAVIVTGGANGLDPAAKRAFAARMRVEKSLLDSFHVFRKDGGPDGRR